MVEPGQESTRGTFALWEGGPAARAGKAGSAALLFGYERARAWVNMGQSPIPPYYTYNEGLA